MMEDIRKVILITGGQRSGKSCFAQGIALEAAQTPVYLATSRVWDDEYRKRIERHKAERKERWINLEEEKLIGSCNLNGQTVVIDCVTLWATNFFYDFDGDVQQSLDGLKTEFDKIVEQNATLIFVTNEIGMGEMSQNELQRKFADLQGWFNQYIASRSDEVFLMVSGIPVKIK